MNPFYSEGGITIYHAKAEEVVPHLGMFGGVILDQPCSLDLARVREQCPLAKMGKTAIVLLRAGYMVLGHDPLQDQVKLNDSLIPVACGGHYAVRPLDAMRRIVRLTDGSILDPYMGSGTTLVAAKEIGREAVGIEMDLNYCLIAVERLSAA